VQLLSCLLFVGL